MLHTYGSWEFFSLQPNCPKQPRTSFPFYKFFYPAISGKISGLDFRFDFTPLFHALASIVCMQAYNYIHNDFQKK
jgi:hypothetical protein